MPDMDLVHVGGLRFTVSRIRDVFGCNWFRLPKAAEQCSCKTFAALVMVV